MSTVSQLSSCDFLKQRFPAGELRQKLSEVNTLLTEYVSFPTMDKKQQVLEEIKIVQDTISSFREAYELKAVELLKKWMDGFTNIPPIEKYTITFYGDGLLKVVASFDFTRENAPQYWPEMINFLDGEVTLSENISSLKNLRSISGLSLDACKVFEAPHLEDAGYIKKENDVEGKYIFPELRYATHINVHGFDAFSALNLRKAYHLTLADGKSVELPVLEDVVKKLIFQQISTSIYLPSLKKVGSPADHSCILEVKGCTSFQAPQLQVINAELNLGDFEKNEKCSVDLSGLQEITDDLFLFLSEESQVNLSNLEKAGSLLDVQTLSSLEIFMKFFPKLHEIKGRSYYPASGSSPVNVSIVVTSEQLKTDLEKIKEEGKLHLNGEVFLSEN